MFSKLLVRKTNTAEDFRLVELIHRGDVAGLAGLFDRYGAASVQVACRLVATRALAEQVVFDVFLWTWRKPPPPTEPTRQFFVDQTIKAAIERTIPQSRDSTEQVRDAWMQDPQVVTAITTFNAAYQAWLEVGAPHLKVSLASSPEQVAAYLRMRAADRAYECARDEAIDRARYTPLAAAETRRRR